MILSNFFLSIVYDNKIFLKSEVLEPLIVAYFRLFSLVKGRGKFQTSSGLYIFRASMQIYRINLRFQNRYKTARAGVAVCLNVSTTGAIFFKLNSK